MTTTDAGRAAMRAAAVEPTIAERLALDEVEWAIRNLRSCMPDRGEVLSHNLRFIASQLLAAAEHMEAR